MPKHAFDRTHRDIPSEIAEDSLHGKRFDRIVFFCSSSMRRDVIHQRPTICTARTRINSRLRKSLQHRCCGAATSRFNIRDAIRICARTKPNQFCKRLHATRTRMLERFKNDHACAFTHHKSTAREIERTTRFGWIVFAGTESSQTIESCHTKNMNHGVSTTCDHHISLAESQNARCFANCLRACSASRQTVVRRTARAKFSSDVRKRHVRFLFNFSSGIQNSKSNFRPLRSISLPRLRIPRFQIRRKIIWSIDHALACAEIHANAAHVARGLDIQTRLTPRLRSSTKSEL